MKYTKSELKRSLFDGISLMTRGAVRKVPRTAFGAQEFKWATFEEIEALRKEDWYLVNDQKRMLYRSWRLGEAKRKAKKQRR